jgi:hypothetical protein
MMTKHWPIERLALDSSHCIPLNISGFLFHLQIVTAEHSILRDEFGYVDDSLEWPLQLLPFNMLHVATGLVFPMVHVISVVVPRLLWPRCLTR